jgi:hypothetical protein
VWTLLRDLDELARDALQELDGIDAAAGADDVQHMGDGAAQRRAEIEDGRFGQDAEVAHRQHARVDLRVLRVTCGEWRLTETAEVSAETEFHAAKNVGRKLVRRAFAAGRD